MSWSLAGPAYGKTNILNSHNFVTLRELHIRRFDRHCVPSGNKVRHLAAKFEQTETMGHRSYSGRSHKIALRENMDSVRDDVVKIPMNLVKRVSERLA